MRADVEKRAGQVLAEVPDWIWDGERLPVPVEHVVDSCFGFLLPRHVRTSSAGRVDEDDVETVTAPKTHRRRLPRS